MNVFIHYLTESGAEHKAVLNLNETRMLPVVNTNKATLIYRNGNREQITIINMSRIQNQ